MNRANFETESVRVIAAREEILLFEIDETILALKRRNDKFKSPLIQDLLYLEAERLGSFPSVSRPIEHSLSPNIVGERSSRLATVHVGKR